MTKNNKSSLSTAPDASNVQCKGTNISPIKQGSDAEKVVANINSMVETVTAKKNVPKSTTYLKVGVATAQLEYAKTLPPIKVLYAGMIVEGEINYFCASPGVGKTIMAYETADAIAKSGIRTFYADAELSLRQFYLRYPTHRFSSNLLRAEIDNTNGVCENLFDEIIHAAELNKAEFVVIDNISAISDDTEKGSSASQLMNRILAVKRTHPTWTLLVILHVPKMYADVEMSLNSVGGSAKLSQLCDNVVGFGQSKLDENQFYAKTLKWRDAEKPYTSDNVLILERGKDAEGNMTITEVGFGRERDLLKVRTDDEEQALTDNVMEYKRNGVSIRETAKKLGISPSKVNRIIHKNS